MEFVVQISEDATDVWKWDFVFIIIGAVYRKHRPENRPKNFGIMNWLMQRKICKQSNNKEMHISLQKSI